MHTKRECNTNTKKHNQNTNQKAGETERDEIYVTHTHTHTHAQMTERLCVRARVCVCVCEREREIERRACVNLTHASTNIAQKTGFDVLWQEQTETKCTKEELHGKETHTQRESCLPLNTSPSQSVSFFDQSNLKNQCFVSLALECVDVGGQLRVTPTVCPLCCSLALVSTDGFVSTLAQQKLHHGTLVPVCRTNQARVTL